MNCNDVFILATFTQKNGTKLTVQDIKNICYDIQMGTPYSEVQKKYIIGGSRLTRILKICKVKSVIGGGWENMNPIDIKLRNEYLSDFENVSQNEKNNESAIQSESSNIDQLLSKQIEDMKKNIESIKFKSFIE